MNLNVTFGYFLGFSWGKKKTTKSHSRWIAVNVHTNIPLKTQGRRNCMCAVLTLLLQSVGLMSTAGDEKAAHQVYVQLISRGKPSVHHFKHELMWFSNGAQFNSWVRMSSYTADGASCLEQLAGATHTHPAGSRSSRMSSWHKRSCY